MWDLYFEQDKGDCAFIDLLILASEAGGRAEMACDLALKGAIVDAAIVLNQLCSLIAPSSGVCIDVTGQYRCTT